ncbi:serine/threonine-protein kinase [Novipirellula caenicola]|uniref:Serine/threonine-protein kinase PknD n=1 Tax=Novipirellula caenicola TaxID=1536901 RepID=A0ABP9VYR6_9BACT
MKSPEFLGPYRVGETLGRGGMGAVYVGVHEHTGEKVAVKLIATHVADEPRFRRRFNSEVETLKRLRHPGIVRLIGYGEEDGQLFYSMELVDGESLQQRIRRQKRIHWQAVIDIAIEICGALKHAHDFGVIHRDLKPANLILSTSGKVKLVDFGIAKLFGFGEQTLAGSILGTADYMAPEQADSSGVSVRTDLYALGSVMYAMLTGRPPFPGKRTTEVIEALRRDRPVPLELIDSELPEALCELVHQLLEKDPSDRPPTALSVMNRLKAMRAGLLRQQTLPDHSMPTAHAVPERDQPPAKPIGESTEKTDAGGHDTTGLSVHPMTGGRPPSEEIRTADLGNPPDSEPPVSENANPHYSATVASQNTVVSDPPTNVEDDAQTPTDTVSRSTHFQSVDSDPQHASERSASGSPAEHWKQAISISLMTAVLIAGMILFFKAAEQPTADELYQVIAEHSEAENPGEARLEMDQFIKRFPDDPRYETVNRLRHSIDLQRLVRRLSVQAKLDISPLSAAEQGFLDAINGREQDAVGAASRLTQWLAIYDTQTLQEDRPLAEMIELAKHEVQLLRERAPVVIHDPRAVQLLDRIRQTVENAPPQTAREALTGIIQLHADHDWAEPAVEEARRQLEKLPPPSPAR